MKYEKLEPKNNNVLIFFFFWFKTKLCNLYEREIALELRERSDI